MAKRKTNNIEVTEEQIREALEECYGILTRACVYLRQTHGIEISRFTLKHRIDEMDLNDFVKKCRISMNELSLASLHDSILDNQQWAVKMQLGMFGKYDDLLVGDTEEMVKSKYRQKEQENEYSQKKQQLSELLEYFAEQEKDVLSDSLADEPS